MHAIIDLSSELLIDRSRVADPYLRLFLTAVGEQLAKGSPWIAVDKEIASRHGVAGRFFLRQRQAVDA
jgi:hypothetical protein